ncbi:MAG: 2,4-dienoyl-CoA reductase-like NADH-dependent reductase (Old Yellow Enzyme family) [Halobacteriales archaeon]|jgi:2,4-dienoyl-CoA reductase-like NADH-dependent reductase (Old Yellow Enzyme family)
MSRFDPDEDRVRFLREIAEDVRGESSESKQLASIIYRISDLYDEDEETSPREIYLAVRNIMNVKARGGLSDREGD